MKTITLFKENIILDKEIYIFLDMAAIDKAEKEKLFESRDQIYITVSDTAAAIKEGRRKIFTTCTHFLSAAYMEQGYEIKILNKNKNISMTDILNGKYTLTREVHPYHNWEKMLYNGCFEISSNF